MPSNHPGCMAQNKSTPAPKLLPVTLLSGFLGSGKTTLLKHILQENHGLKVAVIVNDMAELNIDAALISKSGGGQLVKRAESLVQMQNGCICCTLREDLLDEVSKLAKDSRFDYCVIESTGISEPMQVAETFASQLPSPEEITAAEAEGAQEEQGVGKKTKVRKEAGEAPPEKKSKASNPAAESGSRGGPAKQKEDTARDAGNGKSNSQTAKEHEKDHSGTSCPLHGAPTLMDLARLDTCVTVVDASRFYDDLTSIEELKDRHPEETPDGDMRNIAQLLVDQVEFADVILLNKADVVSMEQLKDIHAMLKRLNPMAVIHETVQSRVPLTEVLNTQRFNMEKANQAPGWLQAINVTNAADRAGQQAALRTESEEYGVTSFVYTARRPFHPGRLYRNFMRKYFLTQVLPGDDDDDDDDEQEEGKDGENGGEKATDTEGKDKKGGEKDEGKASDDEEDDERDLSAYEDARREVLAAAKKDLGTLLRSKGFFWLATQRDSVLGWSSAGALLQVSKEGPWFDCVPREEWPEDEEIKSRIQADFCSDLEIGDRRQELVFIGQNLKDEAISELLDSCLATQEEIAAAKEGNLRDELFGGFNECF